MLDWHSCQIKLLLLLLLLCINRTKRLMIHVDAACSWRSVIFVCYRTLQGRGIFTNFKLGILKFYDNPVCQIILVLCT